MSSCLRDNRPFPGETYSAKWEEYASYGEMPGLLQELREIAAVGITTGTDANLTLYGEAVPAVHITPARLENWYCEVITGMLRSAVQGRLSELMSAGVAHEVPLSWLNV